jgi:hypothetical protein
MSYQIGMDTIKLRPTPRLAHTEYCSDDALKRKVTGIPQPSVEQERAFMDQWQFDFIWSTDAGPRPWGQRGRTTDMGHSDFVEGGTDRRQPKLSPFATVEEVLSFDAVAEYGLIDMDELVSFYEGRYQMARQLFPEQVYTGGYYQTLVSGAIEAFGWDMLLLAAGSDLKRFAKVLDTIHQQTMHHAHAWAHTSCEVYMCHDDMVWTQGPFIRPAFYRAEIFPRYKELWQLLHDHGKTVAFTSDGCYDLFIDDVVAAGADCLCFEPMTQLEPVVDKYGQSHCIIGSKVDARTLTLGTKDQIKAEVDATLELAMACPGFMFAVGNHIPSNVPVDNAEFYFQYLSQNWSR